MNKKALIVVVPIILMVMISIFLVLIHIQSLPRETVHRFLQSLSNGDDTYKEHIAPQLQGHTFIELLQQEKVKSFKVTDQKAAGTGSVQVKATVEFETGKVWLYFDVVKSENRWQINRLPDVESYELGMPLQRQVSDKGAIYWTIDIGGTTINVEVHPDSRDALKEGTPAAILTLDGFLAKAEPLSPTVLARVMALTGTMIEDMNKGYLPVKGSFPVYISIDGRLEYAGNFGLPVAAENVILYRDAEDIGMTAVYEKPKRVKDTIRIALRTSGYTSIYHDIVRITCSSGFTVTSPISGKSLKFRGGDIAEFRPLENKTEVYHQGKQIAASMFRWYVRPEGNDSLKVTTIARGHTSSLDGTVYKGILEVAPYNSGLVLINEVNLEEYLKSVVPSEMPVLFGLEALKVQAVAARAYAVRAMQSSGFRFYGAHLDDSTSSQVYNNTVQNDVASHAVEETAGLVPVYDNTVVDTRFFSTSCGYTANCHEVWSNDRKEFPSEQVPYLTARPQFPGNAPSLYNEENFRSFINNKDLPGYDRFSPFFRWETVFSLEQLEAALQANLIKVYNDQPDFVLTRTGNTYKSLDIPEDIGRLQNIEVLKRGAGGNIMELEITTTHGTFKIIKEYNIRQVLKPVNYLQNGKPIELNCHDGSKRTNFPILPSAFAYIDFGRDNEGNITYIRITGGGYGHGVGMSQYGAYGLTLAGKNFIEIIEHYYPGSRLENIYD